MLSTTSEYALRALAVLAGRPMGTALLGKDLARAADIPANYLSKILVALRNAGLVDASRGAKGGYRLHKSAAEIHFIDVVELFDGGLRNQPACFLRRQKHCSESPPCNAHESWRKILTAYLDFLTSTPLSALVSQSKGFVVFPGQPSITIPSQGGPV